MSKQNQSNQNDELLDEFFQDDAGSISDSQMQSQTQTQVKSSIQNNSHSLQRQAQNDDFINSSNSSNLQIKTQSKIAEPVESEIKKEIQNKSKSTLNPRTQFQSNIQNQKQENNKDKLIQLIQNSGLSQDNAESFVYFLTDVADENCQHIVEFLITQKGETLENNWVILRAKLSFLEELDQRGGLSVNELQQAKQKIVKMSELEFQELVEMIDSIENEEDLIQKQVELKQMEEDLNQEFITVADKLLSEIKQATVQAKQSNDQKKYDQLLAAIQN
jgi:hypothetical protein